MKGRRIPVWAAALVLIWMILAVPGEALAAGRDSIPASADMDSDTLSEGLLADLGLERVDEFLEGQDGAGFSMGFEELIRLLMKGDVSAALEGCLGMVKDGLLGELTLNGGWLGQVMVLGLVGALFANFANLFAGGQLTETGFYITYLVMFSLLASSFLTGVSVAKELLASTAEFMRALLPSYFLAVSFAGGAVTSAAGYGWMLAAVGCVDWLLLKILLPAVHIYILTALAGHLVKEDMFSRMTELVEQGIRWSIKTMVGVVVGFHMLQGMVAPYADALKNGAFRRAVSVIPGVGQGAEAVSQMLVGTGVLIKNSMGVGALILLGVISILPLLKLLILCLFYQGAAALLQPICEKRMVECIGAVGKGCRLLLSMTAAAVLMFALSLAIVCMASNAPYFS